MAYERTLEDFENFVFDLDGTVWKWNELKDGVADTIQGLRQRGKTIYFLTNNSILGREAAAKKLNDLGVSTDADHVITGVTMAAEALDSENVSEAFIVGEEGLQRGLKEMNIGQSEDADDVLVGVDRNFSYWKMATAAELVRDGAQLWAAASDDFWWAGDRWMPGTNALVSSILKAADTTEAEVTGKPSKYARETVKQEWRLRPPNTVLVGDSLETDIRFGNMLGYKTGLVLGGVSEEDDLGHVDDFDKPHLVFRQFNRILQKV